MARLIDELVAMSDQGIASNWDNSMQHLSDLIKERHVDQQGSICVSVATKQVEDKLKAWAEEQGLCTTSGTAAFVPSLCLVWGFHPVVSNGSVDASLRSDGALVLPKSTTKV